MNALHFEWDPQKDLTNQKKHGVSFAEASTVFENVNALVISDPEHSEDEERFCDSRIQPAGKSARRLSLLQGIRIDNTN